jgi:predicted DNA-binding protein (UPF0251 family)/predicted Fe-Mo cluster-binding NifX family protein
MARPKRCRHVCRYPRCMSFGPDEERNAGFAILNVDEYETIRLLDYENLTQKECAEQMQVARTTVTDIYERARHKLADCLVNGKKLIIAGGDYQLSQPGADANLSNLEKGMGIMRVAVPYENGEIFQHFGHTEAFKLYDVKDGSVSEVGILRSGESGHGALAGLLKEAKADALICGGIGFGAQMALQEEGIKLYAGVTGSCDEAVKALAQGTLEASGEANCSHHHEDGRHCGTHESCHCQH